MIVGVGSLKKTGIYKAARSFFYWNFVEKRVIRTVVNDCVERSLRLSSQKKDMVFYMAAAPGESQLVLDLIDSIKYYTEADWGLVIQGDGLSEEEVRLYEECGALVGNNPVPLKFDGLFYTVRSALTIARSAFDAAFYIKLDSDSLMINPLHLGDLEAVFSSDPGLGMAGSFLRDWDGSERDFSSWRDKMFMQRRSLEPVYGMARNYGYDGEGVQGGVYIITRRAVDLMYEKGFLTKWNSVRILRPWRVAEDHLFTMMVYACKMKVACVGGVNGLVVSAYPSFPEADPMIFKNEGRVFVHPLKKNDREIRIRELYRRLRGKVAGSF